MRGGMRERRPGVWEVRAELGRDPISGRRKQISRTVRGTKRQAEAVLNKLVAEVDRDLPVATDATFRDVAKRWISLAEADLSPSTLRRYRILLTNHIYPAIGDTRASRIRTTDLDDLYQALVRRSGLSPTTVRQIHAIIRRALSQAVRWGWIATNPAANTSPPRVTPAGIKPPEVEQVQKLLDAARTSYPELGRFLHLAVTTGARRGELCALRWERIDWPTRTLTISRSIIEVPGGLAEKGTKTHGIRSIALDVQTTRVLAEHCRAMAARANEADADLNRSGYVFSPDPGGSVPWSPDHVTKSFQRLRDQLGYTGLRLHDLRHFAATRLLAAGVPVRTVSGRLGHANAATTLGVYAHFVQAPDRVAAETLASVLAPTAHH